MPDYGKELTDLPFYMSWYCPGEEIEHPCSEVCDNQKRYVKFINRCGAVFGNDKLYLISELHGHLVYLYGQLAEDFILSGALFQEMRSESALQAAQRAIIQQLSVTGFSQILARIWNERDKKNEEGK